MGETITVCEVIVSATKCAKQWIVSACKGLSSHIKDCCSDTGLDEGVEGLPSVEVIEKNVSTASSAPKETPGGKDATNPETKERKKMTFCYTNPQAKDVKISGSFLGWNTKHMAKKKDGVWATSFELMPGRYTYKYIVDGQWIKDPDNPKHLPDGYGGESSVREVV